MKDLTQFQDRYLSTLGLKGDDEPSKKKRKKALARAYELRTFEIEHYWKRATYFWGFQIAIFAAFGLLWRESNPEVSKPWSPVAVALALLGVVTATANFLSARGSRFWQNNWELHIDMLEDEIEGRLYKTVWVPDGKPSFSVSRVNQCLGICFILFWAFVVVFVFYNIVGKDSVSANVHYWLAVCVIFIVAMLIGYHFLTSLKSNLLGTYPNQDGSHNHSRTVGRGSRWEKSEKFMSRYAPDENPPIA